MRRVLPLLLLCLLAQPAAAEKRHATMDAEAMARSVNALALKLHAQQAEHENVFFSPYSISAAIAMTRAGARGETATEMDAALAYPAELGHHQGALASALRARMVREYDAKGGTKMVPAYALNIANALWGQEGFPFLPAFLGTTKRFYGAPLFRIDFRKQEAARKTINEWVEKQTRDKIRNIVPPGSPPPNSRLVLANAIYFKAGWAKRFAKSATKERPWHGPDGTAEKASLMRRVGHFGYAEDDDVQVAELTYRGGDTSMVVILPKAKDGLAAVERALTTEKLTTWMGALESRKLDLQLPKWKFTWSREVSRDLVQLGMRKAFLADQADFSGITEKEPLFIGMVLHKAFVAVDEEGTEAAAATVIIMPTGAAPRPSTPTPFVADHPFLFLVRHRKTGAILFLGRLVNPVTEPA